MESASRRGKKQAPRQEVVPAPSPPAAVPLWAELPLLLALFLAPILAGGIPPLFPSVYTVGTQDPLPGLLLCCLVWLGLVLRVVFPGAPPVARPRAGWLLILFPLLSALTFFWSATPGETAIQTVFYASYAVLAWLAADLVQRGRSGLLFVALLGGALVTGGFGLRDYLKELRGGNTSWRAFGWFTNPNFLAGFLAPALLLTLGQSFRMPAEFKPSTWGLALGLICVTLTAGLMATGSRGAILALGVGLLVFLVVAAVRHFRTPAEERDRSTLPRVGVMLALVVATVLFFSGPLRARTLTGDAKGTLPAELCPPETSTGAEDSAAFRKYTWQGALRMGKARPLQGWGAGTFDTAFAPFAVAGYTRHAHNSYLQLFAEEGVLAPLLWLALLGVVAWGLWSAPRVEEWSWVPGGLGALAASAAHNVFDSLLYVPAIAILIWAIVGMGLARPSVAPAAQPAPGAERRRWAALVVGIAGLLLAGIHTWGRYLLLDAREQTGPMASQVNGALKTLETAQALLPWDYQVALQQSRTARYLGVGDLQQAIDAAQRVIRLAPYRPASYFSVGFLRERQGDKLNAVQTYRVGLEHAPNEVELLYPLAQAEEGLGFHKEALQAYRKIAEVEGTPVQQVRALPELRDWRYARARLALAREADATGNKEEAFNQRKTAACFLGQRHRLVDGGPDTYRSMGDWDPDLERELRTDEEQLWRWLAEAYHRRGEDRLAALCTEQVEVVNQSRATLEKILAVSLPGGS